MSTQPQPTAAPAPGTAPVTALEARAIALPPAARAVTITDQLTFDAAGRLLRAVVTVKREIEEQHAPIKAAKYREHQEACAEERRVLAYAVLAESILSAEIARFEKIKREEQEAIRRKEQEEAEIFAEMDRHDRMKEAERVANLETERLKQEMATVEEKSVVEEQRAAVVEAAMAQAAQSTPVAIIYREPEVLAPIPGVKVTTKYTVEVFDVKALCGAVNDGIVPVSVVEPHATNLNKYANLDPAKFSVPGCRLVEKAPQVRARRLPRK